MGVPKTSSQTYDIVPFEQNIARWNLCPGVIFFSHLPAEGVVQIGLVFWNDCNAESHYLGTYLKDQQNQMAITKRPLEYQEGKGTDEW